MCETICFIIQEIQNFCLIGWSYILKLIKCIFEIETLLAIFGGYIAWQQWQTSERKRKQDLFEKRYDNLYLPILKCSESIMHIKDSKVSKEKRKQQIENEIAEFWRQYNKYKFLISEQDDEKLNNHYKYILEIVQNNGASDVEQLGNLFALLGHLSQMEMLLAQYLRIEQGSLLYKIRKCFQKKYSMKEIITMLANSSQQQDNNTKK